MSHEVEQPQAETHTPLLSVLIATRGKLPMLKNCLSALKTGLEGIDAEVVIVEHETADAGPYVHDRYPEFRLFRVTNEEIDHTFSTINNFAALQSKGKYLLLMNNDVIVRKDTLAEMLKVMEEKPDVGVVGAKLLFPSREIQHVGVVFNAHGIPYHVAYQKRDGPETPQSERSEYFDAVTGACMLVRREVWEALGGLDTDFCWNYEDVDFCLRARTIDYRCFVTHKAVAIHLESQSANHRQTGKHGVVANLKIFQDKWILNNKLEEVTGHPVEKRFGPIKYDNLNIAFFPGGKGAGIAWWRMDLIARKILEKRLANVQIIHGDAPEATVMGVIDRADVTIWQSHCSESVKVIASFGKERSFRMIYEYDDHPIHLSPWSDAYRGLGTREIKITAANGDEAWLWRDGENNFDLRKNREQRLRHMEIMSLCDALTTTTQPLAEYFRTINPNVYMLPNCIDFSLYPVMKEHFDRKKDGPVRIGWWGGDNHWHDIAAVGPWLTRYINDRDVRLVLLGAFYRGPLRGIDLNKVEESKWVHVEAFSWRLGAAAIDLAVIPLANPTLPEMKFNTFKSPIKFLEAAALKIPSVVQGDTRPYDCCHDGENALTYTTEEEFRDKMDALVKDAELRAVLGQRAYEYAREYHDLDKEIGRWMECYERVYAGGQEPAVEAGRPAAPVAVAEGA